MTKINWRILEEVGNLQIKKKKSEMNPKGGAEGMMVKALGSHRFTDEALSSFKFKQ